MMKRQKNLAAGSTIRTLQVLYQDNRKKITRRLEMIKIDKEQFDEETYPFELEQEAQDVGSNCLSDHKRPADDDETDDDLDEYLKRRKEELKKYLDFESKPQIDKNGSVQVKEEVEVIEIDDGLEEEDCEEEEDEAEASGYYEEEGNEQAAESNRDEDESLDRRLLDLNATEGVDYFSCHLPDCNKVFKTVSGLIGHQNIHACKFVCEFCSRRCSSKNDLNRHLRTHTGERPYACEEDGCQKRFTARKSLEQHKACAHSEERPFVCPIENCNKTFKLVKYLESHLQYHSSERPYTCTFDQCGKKFKTKTDLNHHIDSHFEGRFKCPFDDCERVCKRKSDLRKHLRAHEKRSFPCLLCDKTYIFKKQLIQHEQVHHATSNGFRYGTEFLLN